MKHFTRFIITLIFLSFFLQAQDSVLPFESIYI